MIGSTFHSLTWLWGAWGEENTADQLKELGDEWFVIHDLASSYGNWDHVVVGPGGLFLLRHKRVSRAARYRPTPLTSGRTRIPGATFRGAAVWTEGTHSSRYTPTCPWVQAVVVIGEFDVGPREEERVTYIAGPELGLLDRSPAINLSTERCAAVIQALHGLASTPRPTAARTTFLSVRLGLARPIVSPIERSQL